MPRPEESIINKIGVKLLYRLEMCFAAPERPEGWGAKRISNQEFLALF